MNAFFKLIASDTNIDPAFKRAVVDSYEPLLSDDEYRAKRDADDEYFRDTHEARFTGMDGEFACYSGVQL